MVEAKAERGRDLTVSDAGKRKGEEAVEGAAGGGGQQEEERKAVEEHQTEHTKVAEDEIKQESGNGEQHAAADVNGVKEEDGEELDFSALGSAEDIAAAALEAANISSLFGSSDDTRGTKRSHDDMAESDDHKEAIAPESLGASSSTSESIQAAVPPPRIAPMSAAPPTTVVPHSLPPSSVAHAPIQYTGASIEGIGAGASETAVTDEAFLGSLDLEAVAQAAMGLDANGNPLPGNEESHRALADAVKQLSAAQGVTLSSTRNGDDESSDNGGGPAKRFQCTQCERAFARAYNLNTHLATHDPDPSRSKPFPCPYPSCKTEGGRSFSRKHDLQRHVASTHENEPEPITSTMGENGLRQTGALASLGLGTPGRKFRCDDCGRAFVRRDALKRHQCTKVMETSSNQSLSRQAQDYYSNNLTGLSLYTSNAPSTSTHLQQSQSAPVTKATDSAESSYDSDPFGPNGITYENLSKEVQDMAMQLVAQAQSYNEQQEEPGAEKTASVAASTQAVAPAAIVSAAPALPPVSQPAVIRPLPTSTAGPVTSVAPSTTVKVEQAPSSSHPPTSKPSGASAPSSAITSSTSHAPKVDPISAQ